MEEENKTTKKNKRRSRCKQCNRLSFKLKNGLCSRCRDASPNMCDHKQKIKLTKKQQQDDDRLKMLVQDISSLYSDDRWKSFKEALDIIQGNYVRELLSPEFAKLKPDEKDIRHRVILEVLEVIDKVHGLPGLLDKNRPSVWLEYEKMMMEQFNQKGGI